MAIHLNLIGLALLFLAVALVASLVGARGVAGVSANIARLMVGVFVAIIIVGLLVSLVGPISF